MVMPYDNHINCYPPWSQVATQSFNRSLVENRRLVAIGVPRLRSLLSWGPKSSHDGSSSDKVERATRAAT